MFLLSCNNWKLYGFSGAGPPMPLRRWHVIFVRGNRGNLSFGVTNVVQVANSSKRATKMAASTSSIEELFSCLKEVGLSVTCGSWGAFSRVSSNPSIFARVTALHCWFKVVHDKNLSFRDDLFYAISWRLPQLAKQSYHFEFCRKNRSFVCICTLNYSPKRSTLTSSSSSHWSFLKMSFISIRPSLRENR